MLPCQHDEAPHGEAVCDHLRADAPAWVQVKRWYTGVGLTAELICEGCAAEREAGASTVSTGRLCRACFEHLVEDVVDVVGVGGRPGLLERAEPMVMDLDSTPLPRTLGRVVDLAPLETGRGSHWLVLTEEAIHRFDADAAELERLAVVEAMPEPGHQPWCGHVLTPRLRVP
ncbi:MAG: hypothetical protein R3B72_48140 [Polyangiaceae bacterium]